MPIWKKVTYPFLRKLKHCLFVIYIYPARGACSYCPHSYLAPWTNNLIVFSQKTLITKKKGYCDLLFFILEWSALILIVYVLKVLFWELVLQCYVSEWRDTNTGFIMDSQSRIIHHNVHSYNFQVIIQPYILPKLNFALHKRQVLILA